MITRKILVGRMSEIPPGGVKHFSFGIHRAILYNDEGEWKAYLNVCTHMGGPVELDRADGVFRCRWHQAEFDPKSGAAIHGQAPQGTSLKPIALEIQNGDIFAILQLSNEN